MSRGRFEISGESWKAGKRQGMKEPHMEGVAIYQGDVIGTVLLTTNLFKIEN